MGIWIRSQDGKGLFLVNDIYVKESKIVFPTDFGHAELGRYDTEKRIKEVIDDIVAYIRNYKTFVYQMPKE